MKNIITVRHTQSVQHTNGMIGSWTDWELTQLGKERAERIGHRLAAELWGRSCKIFSSDLLRAKQTAAPLARYMNLPVEFRRELREINYGEACVKSKAWAREHKSPLKSFDAPEYPSAEPWRAFWNRVSHIQKEIIADKAENIVVVSHAGTMKVWQELWSGAELREYTQYGKSGGVSFFRLLDTGERVTVLLNDMSYQEE